MRRGRHIWTPEEVQFLKAFYPDVRTRHLADMLGVSEHSVFQKSKSLGLKKSRRYRDALQKELGSRLHISGEAHQFAKGHTPANKGKKLTPEQREKIAHTWFQKGHKPQNTLYDGAIRVRHCHGRPVKYIRLAEGEWRHLARHNWEKAHGAIPPGHVIIHLDNDPLNCDIENLRCIEQKYHVRINQMGGAALPPEMKEGVVLLYKLKTSIHEKQNH